MSVTPEERREWNAERMRRYREANKEKESEQGRRRYEANREKALEKNRRHYEANKEKLREKNHRYRETNKEKVEETSRRYRETNKEKLAKKNRRYARQKSFARENGSSYPAWQASLAQPAKVFESIANLQPDPGQTLAELIHELSGYAMEVCEQIANPPVIEDSPALTPPAAPDLF